MRKADNLPPSCAVVTKSGDLNFLEPSGPVQAGNGTALPFFILIIRVSYVLPSVLSYNCCVTKTGQCKANLNSRIESYKFLPNTDINSLPLAFSMPLATYVPVHITAQT